MPLQVEDFVDITNTTLRDLGRGRITDIASDLQEHVAMSRFYDSKNKRIEFDNGTQIQFDALTSGDNNFRWVGLYAPRNLNQLDSTIQGNVPWRHALTGMTWDVFQKMVNKSPSKIVDFLKTKKYQCLVTIADELEAAFWGEPSSSTDTVTPFGIKYWITYSASTGFNGGNNSNFSSGPASISRTTYPRWSNYTANYAAGEENQTGVFRDMRAAMWNCNFKPAVKNRPIPGFGSGGKYSICTTYATESLLVEEVEGRNENLGAAIDPYDGRVVIRRTPVEAVPYLEQNEGTADPIVGIDWSVFKLMAFKGQWLSEEPAKPAPNQPTVINVDIISRCNFVCYEPRRLWLIAKSDWSA